MKRGTLALLVVASLMLVPLASAEHGRQGVTFDSKGGNEWWVELQLGGSYDSWWTPAVRDTNGDWKSMKQPDWAPNDGFYAATYHVEPGHEVQFQLQNRGEYLLSCWFTHPEGEERCDGTEDFSATFTPSGDASAVRVAVDATHDVDRVAFSVHEGGGFYVTMTEESEGVWAWHGYVPDEVVFQFIARSETTQDYATSGCWEWREVAPVECPDPYRGSAYSPRAPTGDWSYMEVLTNQDPSRVEVRFDGGEFQDMTKKSDDSDVWFYANAPDSGDHVAEFRVTSDEGEIACGNDGYNWPYEGSYSTTVGTYEEAIFAEMKGNENWVQTNVYSWERIVMVEAQVDGGEWHSLEHRSWCDWAEALDAPEGSTVQFRAFFTDLAYDTSDPVVWPPGSQAPPPDDDGEREFAATFDDVSGNEWWLQVDVDSHETVSEVHASVNDGPWQPLELKSWGDWAESYRAPEGAKVQFRATSSDGATALSGCYRWTSASPIDCDADDERTFDATFKNVRGNEWWVESDVSATGGTIASVDARVNFGEWRPLERTDWGSWARTMHVPEGSTVSFRAVSTAGERDISTSYDWPPS